MKVPLLLSFLIFTLSVYAQKGDHFKSLEEKKLKCETILAEFSGKPESLDLLIKEGKQGLQLTDKKDYEYILIFNQAIASGYYYKQDFKSAKEHFEKALIAANEGKLIDKSLKPLGALVSINHYMGLSKEAEEAAEKLRIAVESVSDPKIKSDAFYNLGLFNQQQKFYYGIALDYFLKSIEINKPIIDTTKIVKLKIDYGVRVMMVAEIYLYLKQPEKALQYLNEAKSILGLSLITDIVAYGKFVRTYALLKDEKEAEKYYKLLHETAAKTNGNWSELVSSSLTMATMALDNKSFAKAKAYIDKASVQAKKDNKDIMISSVNLAYGDYYKALKDYKNAVTYYQISAPSVELYNKEQYLDLLKSLTTAEMMVGNSRDAAISHNKYISLSDSLMDSKISLNIAEMEARFQNKEKQLKIDTQNIELAYAKSQRLWMAMGLILISLVAILLVVNYRNKKRTADLLDEKNKKLTQLNDDLEEANQTKAKLFGIISHDLRSPISQVYQFLKLQQLNPQLLNENQKSELSNKIQNATGSLLETMEELLLWSKSQMNQFKTDVQLVDLRTLLVQTLELVRLNSEAKGIQMNNKVLQGTLVEADPYYLQTIIRNLVQNAIKVSPEKGEINITYTSEGNVLSISNDGGAFTNQQYHNILNSTENGLSGLGLKLVDELSRKTGILVDFVNPAPNQTRVELAFGKS